MLGFGLGKAVILMMVMKITTMKMAAPMTTIVEIDEDRKCMALMIDIA